LPIWIDFINWSLENDYITSQNEGLTEEIFTKARSSLKSHPESKSVWLKMADFEILRSKPGNTFLTYFLAIKTNLLDLEELEEKALKLLREDYAGIK
jgi:hypothetical protein